MTKDPRERYWEVDFLRGVAVVMMIVFHCLFDINYFAIYWFNLSSGFWLLFRIVGAVIFFFLVGVSLTLSYSKIKENKESEIWRKYLKRGLTIFGYGMVITVVTWLFMGRADIKFGALHFIGVAILISRPFFNLRYWNLILGGLCIGAGLYVQKFKLMTPWLIWVGLRQSGAYNIDYYPLLPWFGVVLLGIFFGNFFYPDGVRRLGIWTRSIPPARLFCLLGRRSLLIYFLHQPVLIGIIYAFFL